MRKRPELFEYLNPDWLQVWVKLEVWRDRAMEEFEMKNEWSVCSTNVHNNPFCERTVRTYEVIKYNKMLPL